MSVTIPSLDNTTRPARPAVHDHQGWAHVSIAENVHLLPEDSTRLDEQLIRRIAQGDSEAFGSLYDRYSKLLYSLATRILNDPSEAEDVLQEVFLKIWEKASSFNVAVGRPFSWLVTITRNKAIERLRARRRKSRLLQERGELAIAAEHVDEPHSWEKIEPDESRQIRAAVNELSHNQRHPIELAFFGGLTHVEIADTLQEPLGTIKARIRRGMLRLRDSLEGTDVGVC